MEEWTVRDNEGEAQVSLAEAMKFGTAEYQADLDSLRAAGVPGSFTQTGGMCAALEVRLERGYLLVTDAGEELPWDKSYQRGWGVGYYDGDDVSEGPKEYVENEGDASAEAMIALVQACLQTVATGRS